MQQPGRTSIGVLALLVGAALLTATFGLAEPGGPDAVVAAYAADVPFDLAAPAWLPDGYELVDGDGPWTRLDLDRDGTLESVRAELHYATGPDEHPPSVMIAQQTDHDLPRSLRERPAVTLADGTTAYLSAEDPWWALWWRRDDGITTSIVARGLDREQLVRIASSMQPVG